MLVTVECVDISIFFDKLRNLVSATIAALLAHVSEPDPPEAVRMSTESARVISPGDAEGLTRQQAAVCGIGSWQGTRPSEDTLQRDQTRDQSESLHLETARNKMGNLISKLATHLSPNQLSDDGNTAATAKSPRDPKQKHLMAPGVDEMPSPTGSTTSLDSVTGGDGGPRPLGSLLWPYTGVRITGESCSDGDYAPLRVRRPAL